MLLSSTACVTKYRNVCQGGAQGTEHHWKLLQVCLAEVFCQPKLVMIAPAQ